MLDLLHRLWKVFIDAPEDEQIHIFVQCGTGESERLLTSTELTYVMT